MHPGANLLILNKKRGACVDCRREFPPVCMELVYIDKSTRKMHLGQAMLRRPDDLMKELRKYVPVCANCMRIRLDDAKAARRRKVAINCMAVGE